ncbi:Pimeloyl-ACP methyl ester carboxylesterase [Myroides marinus]|uniref:Pimeloyl-ACP methyl ester carboxylesterase n=1 Tax=Myroides marinus TaxID=703342 RepID=A0A1H6UWU5_9FLAO|nr:alpha/beta hydrolase [Myroides marinus]SEI92790.1 Pimeloyl-ACP methyl ester carboxylesterase [Myroides marinus]
MSAESLNNELVGLLPGFKSECAEVNGTQIHYIIGGQGEPLILIPGYPETWWAYHKVMPALAEKYCVIVVEMRGMGNSAKPTSGYEKKNMAKDVYELVQKLGFDTVSIGGHDIGAHVAFSFASNYPEATTKLIMLDTPHPDAGMYQLPMLPILGGNYTYPWWLAFNQVKDLPEQLLEGRMDLVINWLFDHLVYNKESITDFDKQVYATAYNSKEAIRASNAWYQAFPQDIEDSKSYGKLTMPVLGIGGSGYEMLKMSLPHTTSNLTLKEVKECGHFLLAEKPEAVSKEVIHFLETV